MITLLKTGDKIRLNGSDKLYTITKVSLKWQCLHVAEYINAIPLREVLL